MGSWSSASVPLNFVWGLRSEKKWLRFRDKQSLTWITEKAILDYLIPRLLVTEDNDFTFSLSFLNTCILFCCLHESRSGGVCNRAPTWSPLGPATFTTPSWLETLHVAERHTYVKRDSEPGVQLNVLIREDAKVKTFVEVRAKAEPSPQLFSDLQCSYGLESNPSLPHNRFSPYQLRQHEYGRINQ